MNPVLFDVTGREKYFVNLSLVQQVKVEDCGSHADVTFLYASGDVGTFKVPQGRLVVLLEYLRDLEEASRHIEEYMQLEQLKEE